MGVGAPTALKLSFYTVCEPGNIKSLGIRRCSIRVEPDALCSMLFGHRNGIASLCQKPCKSVVSYSKPCQTLVMPTEMPTANVHGTPFTSLESARNPTLIAQTTDLLDSLIHRDQLAHLLRLRQIPVPDVNRA